MCRIFKIPKLNSLDKYPILMLFPVDQNIVRFDICLK